MSDTITFARAVVPPVSLAKVIMVRDGSIVDVKLSRNAAIFEFDEPRSMTFTASEAPSGRQQGGAI
jgi:hypothetical protein